MIANPATPNPMTRKYRVVYLRFHVYTPTRKQTNLVFHSRSDVLHFAIVYDAKNSHHAMLIYYFYFRIKYERFKFVILE